MYTYTHFKQRNRSQGAANRVNQRKGDKSSVLQLEDNRPEAIAQRKIQEMIANSPRVKQMKWMQNLINGSPKVRQNSSIRGDGIVQMRLLKKGEFNIAGENHPESDARRDDEIKMCAEMVGGKYWNEDEFQIDDNYADPPEYRAKFWIRYAIQNLTRILISPIGREILISSTNRHIDQVDKELEKIEKNKSSSPNVSEQITIIKDRLIDIKSLIENIRDTTPEKVRENKALIRKLNLAMKKEKYDQNRKNKSERTEAMENAFKKANEQKIIGVWKVGDAHIMIINNKKLTTSRKEFNTEYDKWKKKEVEKKKKEGNNNSELMKLPQQENP